MSTSGQVIDQEVLAQRRARRALAGQVERVRNEPSDSAIEERIEDLHRLLEEISSGHGFGPAKLDQNIDTIRATAASVARIHEADTYEYQRALAKSRADAAALRAQAVEWRLRLRTLEVTRSAASVRLAVLESQRADGLSIERSARAALDRQAILLDAERARVRRQTAVIAAERSGRKMLEVEQKNQLQRARAALLRAQKAHQKVRMELTMSQAEATCVKQELTHLQSKYNLLESEKTLQITELSQQVAQLQRQLQITTGELQQAKIEAAAAGLNAKVEDVAVKVLKDELLHSKSAFNEVAIELRAERLEREHAISTLADREALLIESTTQLHEAQAQLELTKAEIRQQKIQIVKFQAQLRVATSERDEVRDEREQARGELLRTTETVERLVSETQELQHENQTLKEQITRLKVELSNNDSDENISGQKDQTRIARNDRDEIEAEHTDRNPGDIHSSHRTNDRDDQSEISSPASVFLRSTSHEKLVSGIDPNLLLGNKGPQASVQQLVADLDAAASALRQSVGLDIQSDHSQGVGGSEMFNHVDFNRGATIAQSIDVDSTADLNQTRNIKTKPSSIPNQLFASVNLRKSLVAYAERNPASAGELIVSLIPALNRIGVRDLGYDLNFDLTVREVGRFAIRSGSQNNEITVKQAAAKTGKKACFHLKTDALTLAKMLTGERPEIKRFKGTTRLSGKRDRFEAFRSAILFSNATFAQLISTGIKPKPELLFDCLTEVLDPSWTVGFSFSTTLEIRGLVPQLPRSASRWKITVDNGNPVNITRVNDTSSASLTDQEGSHATVSMSPEAFYTFLSGDVAPRGERPNIRGDRKAVEPLKVWLDRIFGLDN